MLDASPFYAEGGGQVADTGTLTCGDVGGAEVVTVKAFAGFALHTARVTGGGLSVGDVVTCAVDYERRARIAPNHTMTHLLNFALRQVLGGNTDQKGSIVTADKLRFDFNCKKAMKPEQVAEVERIVREQIARSLPVYTKVVPLSDARSICSLRAVFGETYPDPVRVVSVGADVDALVSDPSNAEWNGLSIELCGGTHIANSADAQDFVVVEDSAISKGVRRVVAYTAAAARRATREAESLRARLGEAASLDGAELVAAEKALNAELERAAISVPVKAELNAVLKGLTDRVKAFKKEAQVALTAQAVELGTQLAAAAAADGQRVIVVSLPTVGVDNSAGRAAVEAMQAAAPEAAVMVWGSDADAGRAACFAASPAPDALNAGAWVRAAIAPAGGKGGGKPGYAAAQAKGSPSDEQVAAGMAAGREFAEKALA